jgi:tRNA C32,U32 (ribose-2'-O)-methylase TrmJ
MMSLYVVGLNRLVWRRLYQLAETSTICENAAFVQALLDALRLVSLIIRTTARNRAQHDTATSVSSSFGKTLR